MYDGLPRDVRTRRGCRVGAERPPVSDLHGLPQTPRKQRTKGEEMYHLFIYLFLI